MEKERKEKGETKNEVKQESHLKSDIATKLLVQSFLKLSFSIQ